MKNIDTNTLITMAKQGNNDATLELWDRVSDIVENTHEHGRVGTRHSRSVRSKYALSFRETSGELYFTFLKCIEDYDASRGASFTTYLSYKVKMFAKDQLRKNKKKVTIKGEKADVKFVSYEGLQERLNNDQSGATEDEENLIADIDSSRLGLDMADSENADNRYASSEEISEEDAELNDTAKDLPSERTYLLGSYSMGRRDLAKEKVGEMLNVFDDGSRKKEVLATYLKMARHFGEAPTVREMGEELGVTGALVSHYMVEIRKDLARAGITLR